MIYTKCRPLKVPPCQPVKDAEKWILFPNSGARNASALQPAPKSIYCLKDLRDELTKMITFSQGS